MEHIAKAIEIVKAGYPDFTAWDPTSNHFDPKSLPAKPRWFMVNVRFVKKFKRFISLHEIKSHPLLQKMPIVQKGSRLSITPVTPAEWKVLLMLSQ